MIASMPQMTNTDLKTRLTQPFKTSKQEDAPPPAPPSGWGLTDQKISGVPNYVLYGAAAVIGGVVLMKLVKRGKK